MWLLAIATMPVLVSKKLAAAKKADRLRDPLVFGPLGLFYESHHSDAYFYELVLLELRLMLIVVGTLSEQIVVSQCFSVIITIAACALQYKLQPFVEDEEEATKWSGLNNQAMATLMCQLMAIVLGMLSTAVAAADSVKGSALGFSIALGSLVALVTPPAMAMTIEYKALREARTLARLLQEQASGQAKGAQDLVTNPMDANNQEQSGTAGK